MTACSNCLTRLGQPTSYDLDLPTVNLCDLCALALLIDPETFEGLAGRSPKKKPDDGARDL